MGFVLSGSVTHGNHIRRNKMITLTLIILYLAIGLFPATFVVNSSELKNMQHDERVVAEKKLYAKWVLFYPVLPFINN